MSPLWNSLTESAKKTIVAAQDEAAGAGSDRLEPIHILLALTANTSCLASVILERLGASPASIHTAAQRKLATPGTSTVRSTEVTLGPAAKQLISCALNESTRSRSAFVGTEHLLVALLVVDRGPAFELLNHLGIEHKNVRAELARYGQPADQPPATISQTFTGFRVGRFADPDGAANWLNRMLADGFTLEFSGATGGQLWMVVKGSITEEMKS